MNKMPPQAVALSVVLAIILWYVATLLDGDRYDIVPTATGPAPQDFGRQTTDSPVLGGAVALRCQDAERRMQTLVDRSRSCVTDDDCTIFDFGYPIQCLTSVSKSEITNLRFEYRNYERECEFRVYYDCPAEPYERRPVCRENRCEVELGTLDDLRDLTFEHLGIEPTR